MVFNDLSNDNRVLNQANSLSNAGYDLTLLGIQRATLLPLEESRNEIKIVRKKMSNAVIEKIKYVRAIYFFGYVWLQITKLAFTKYHVIHCHDLNTLQFGVWIKLIKLGRVKLIYDAHEYETQRNGLHGWWWKYVKVKERVLINFCDRVITVSETIADEYVRLYEINRPVVIFNCPILRTKDIVKKNLFREKFEIPQNKKIYLYQGYLYPGRGIEVVLEAFDELDLNDGVLVFMGEGTLTEFIKSHPKYGKVVFVHPFVSGEVLLGYTSSADCGIAFIEDISLSDRYCLPNKLFEYIAAGLPVISSGLPDLKKFISENKVGASAPTNDVEGFISAFNRMRSLDSASLLKNISKTRSLYNWSTQEAILLEAYINVIS